MCSRRPTVSPLGYIHVSVSALPSHESGTPLRPAINSIFIPVILRRSRVARRSRSRVRVVGRIPVPRFNLAILSAVARVTRILVVHVQLIVATFAPRAETLGISYFLAVLVQVGLVRAGVARDVALSAGLGAIELSRRGVAGQHVVFVFETLLALLAAEEAGEEVAGCVTRGVVVGGGGAEAGLLAARADEEELGQEREDEEEACAALGCRL